jgi:hypothetical protein
MELVVDFWHETGIQVNLLQYVGARDFTYIGRMQLEKHWLVEYLPP